VDEESVRGVEGRASKLAGIRIEGQPIGLGAGLNERLAALGGTVNDWTGIVKWVVESSHANGPILPAPWAMLVLLTASLSVTSTKEKSGVVEAPARYRGRSGCK
jgi:hypothetical protein